MATGGFKSNSGTDFLEEWKAKREKMRAKMLGDIAAATGRTPELNNCTPAPAPTPSSFAVAKSPSSSALRRPDDELKELESPSGNLKKSPEKPSVAVPLREPPGPAGDDSDKESPTHSKSKEKKSSGPSARKGKGQIEKRKLREKRRSTGVVSLPSNESLDELDDDEGEEKERKTEESVTQHNTVQNEAMSPDLEDHHSPQDLQRSRCQKSEEDVANRHRHRQGREGGLSVVATLERRMEELERDLLLERQENVHLLKALEDKDEQILKLKEEIDLLNQDLDDVEDENEQLKQENKTLLKVVSQLTR